MKYYNSMMEYLLENKLSDLEVGNPRFLVCFAAYKDNRCALPEGKKDINMARFIRKIKFKILARIAAGVFIRGNNISVREIERGPKLLITQDGIIYIILKTDEAAWPTDMGVHFVQKGDDFQPGIRGV